MGDGQRATVGVRPDGLKGWAAVMDQWCDKNGVGSRRSTQPSEKKGIVQKTEGLLATDNADGFDVVVQVGGTELPAGVDIQRDQNGSSSVPSIAQEIVDAMGVVDLGQVTDGGQRGMPSANFSDGTVGRVDGDQVGTPGRCSRARGRVFVADQSVELAGRGQGGEVSQKDDEKEHVFKCRHTISGLNLVPGRWEKLRYFVQV